MMHFTRDPLKQQQDDDFSAASSCGKDFDDDEYSDVDIDKNDLLELRIKSSLKDVTVTVPLHSTVLDLKKAVVAALPQAKDRYLRLILKGRLLAPDTAVLSELRVQADDVVHAVIATAAISKQPQGPQAALSRSSTAFQRRSFRGAGINASGLAVRETVGQEEEEEDSDVEAGTDRAGFDRLRNEGMRRPEVTAIRSYFSRHVDRWVRQNAAVAEQAAGTETDPMRRRLLQEDAWMAAQGPTSEFRLNLAGSWQARAMMNATTDAVWRGASVGNDRDFLWGFMLGFFVGFLMIVWVWMPTVPHKQKLGILTGISFQLALGMLKGADSDSDDFVN